MKCGFGTRKGKSAHSHLNKIHDFPYRSLERSSGNSVRKMLGTSERSWEESGKVLVF